jgi:hypothetical protein
LAIKGAPTQTEIEDELLISCKHLCCICHSPFVTIHHIDGDHSNNDPDNLIPLCTTCHGNVESSVPFTRKYTDSQLKKYREDHIKQMKFPVASLLDKVSKMEEMVLAHEDFIQKIGDA